MGLGPAIPLAPVSRDSDYPQSTFAITFVSRRPGDPGFGFPRAVRGWRLDIWRGVKDMGAGAR